MTPIQDQNIQKIINIGRNESCTKEELFFFLPDYPVLYGPEFIFTISWANSRKYVNRDRINFVKGLHIIEEKYKEETHHNFGFGSPCPSYKIITALRRRNQELANNLEEWVRNNGGNYYIKKSRLPQSGMEEPFEEFNA